MKHPLYFRLTVAAAMTAAGVGFAAEPAPPSVVAMQKLSGVVSSNAGGEALVATTDGKTVRVHVTQDSQLMTSRRVDLSALKPGAYVGSANIDQADGSGVSSEVHVFAGPNPGPGMNAPWGGGAMMTNGSVARVTLSADGGRLEINYGAGRKTVFVSPSTPVVMLSPTTDASLIKPGSTVKLAGRGEADGSVTAAYLTVDVPAAP